MDEKRKALALFVVTLAIVAAIVVRIGFYFAFVQNQVRAKTTSSKMKEIMNVLITEEPDVDRDSLERVAAKRNRSGSLVDGWGNELIIEKRADNNGKLIYTVISLGKDGKRGDCCRERVENWEDDAVLENDEWMQVWLYGK